MARVNTWHLFCADCGKGMYRSPTSLPQGQAKCRDCRRASPDYRPQGLKVDYPPKACDVCAKTYKPKRRDSRYCSTGCHDSRSRGRRQTQQCEVCEKTYTPTYDSQRTCGRACGAKINAHLARCKPKPTSCPINWRACRACGQWNTRNRVICRNRECRVQDLRSRHKERYASTAQQTTLPCEDCGKDYTTPTAANCGVCKLCQKRRAKARYGTTHRKRARYFGVEYEPIDRLKVYERDKWRCQLCGKRVKRDRQAPHPLSPSLDHVVPMSKGGDHLYANVQCAHFLCNSLKGDGGSQQLALVG